MAAARTPPKPANSSPRNLDDLLGNAPNRPPRPPGVAAPPSIVPEAPAVPAAHETPRGAQAAHKMTFNLTADNERGLTQLSYWRRGSKAVKTWILNQALAEYLARYPDSQRAIPAEDDE